MKGKGARERERDKKEREIKMGITSELKSGGLGGILKNLLATSAIRVVSPHWSTVPLSLSLWRCLLLSVSSGFSLLICAFSLVLSFLSFGGVNSTTDTRS